MHIANNKFLRVIFAPLVWATKWLGENNPTFLMQVRYFARFHKRLDLKDPKTLNEKILYLSLKTDTSQWTRLADKYAVREYVKECGLENILTQLYAHWTNEDEIDLSVLPNSFVIKSVQGCGDVIIVKDKSKVDKEVFLKKTHPMFHQRYGALEGGMHYMRIKPAVIVEELLQTPDEAPLTDYKIWCFNGQAYYIMTCSNRNKDSVCLGIYDKEWNYKPEYMIFSKEHREEKQPLPRPDNLAELILAAEKLSQGFPCVRVDFYSINGKAYFGEMTFTSLGGMMDYYTDEFQLEAGERIIINNVSK